MNLQKSGSGFQIASHDLAIRGGGNILGASQSGHISAIGYELYTQMMEEAVFEIKGEISSTHTKVKPEINLKIEAYLPTTFIDDEAIRLSIYKRLALTQNGADVEKIKEELLDVYGTIPQQTENLFQVIRIRNKLAEMKALKMTYEQNEIIIRFDSCVSHKEISAFADNVLVFFNGVAKQAKISGEKLIVSCGKLSPQAVTQNMMNMLDAMSGIHASK